MCTQFHECTKLNRTNAVPVHGVRRTHAHTCMLRDAPVDDVHEHHHAQAVGLVDEGFQLVRRAKPAGMPGRARGRGRQVSISLSKMSRI